MPSFTTVSLIEKNNANCRAETHRFFPAKTEFKKVVIARKQKNSRAINRDKGASAEQPSKG